MKSKNKAVIVLICVLVIIVLGLATVMGIGIWRNSRSEYFSEIKGGNLANTQTFDADSVEELRMQYSSDSIRLHSTTGNEIILKEYFSRWDEDMLADVNQSAGRVTIDSGERNIFRMFGFFVSRIELYIPGDWQGDIEVYSSSGSIKTEDNWQFASITVQASSGSVRLGDIECKGDAKISAKSGSVHVGDVTAKGDILVQTSSGSIHTSSLDGASISTASASGSQQIEAVTADSYTGSATSGSIKIDKLNASFDLENSSGSIKVAGGKGHGRAKNTSGGMRITLQELTGDLSFQSSSGDVKLYIPQSTAFYFEAKTSSGSIKAPFEDELSFNRDGDASGTVGTGAKHTVSCSATSGSVRVEWA